MKKKEKSQDTVDSFDEEAVYNPTRNRSGRVSTVSHFLSKNNVNQMISIESDRGRGDRQNTSLDVDVQSGGKSVTMNNTPVTLSVDKEIEVEMIVLQNGLSSSSSSPSSSSTGMTQTSRKLILDGEEETNMQTGLTNRLCLCRALRALMRKKISKIIFCFFMFLLISLGVYLLIVFLTAKNPCVSVALQNFLVSNSTARSSITLPIIGNIDSSISYTNEKFKGIRQRSLGLRDDDHSFFDDDRPHFFDDDFNDDYDWGNINLGHNRSMDLIFYLELNATNLNWFATSLDLSIFNAYYPQYQNYEYHIGSSVDPEKSWIKRDEQISEIIPVYSHLDESIVTTLMKENIDGSFHIQNITFDVVGSVTGSLRLLELVEVGETVDILCSISYFPVHGNYSQVCFPETGTGDCS